MAFPELKEQMDIIREGALEILPEDELEKKIIKSKKKNKPLNIKLGADPSRPDLHIGHAVVLHKMRQFQDLGHNAILIIGDFTAMIGDPTGKSKTRPQLTLEETRVNGQSYIDQASLVLSKERLEVRYNSEWLGKLTFGDVIKLASKYTVAQLLERDDFSKRYKSGTPISVHELMYPLAQAYDSFAIGSDVELGGTDQKFNLLVAREIQRAYDAEPQCLLTVPIIEGTDGVQKMSKSLDNYIALTDSPRDMFGKTMSIPDNLISKYLQYAVFEKPERIKQVEIGLSDNSLHPRDEKVSLAKKIVAKYYDTAAAEAAFEEFERIFIKKDVPDEIDEIVLNLDGTAALILDILTLSKILPSKKEARRMVDQGAVSIDSEKVTDPFSEIDLSEKRLFKVGKRKFLYIRSASSGN